MTKTTLEVVAMAQTRLGVSGMGETPSAEEFALGKSLLSGLLAEVQAAQGITYTWTADEFPDSLFLPFAYLLAVDMAPHYEIAPRDSRAAMIARLRTQAFPDDRPVIADTDEDGTVTEAEQDAADRAAYY